MRWALDKSVISIVTSFLLATVTVVWNIAQFKGDIDKRLSVIETEVLFIKHFLRGPGSHIVGVNHMPASLLSLDPNDSVTLVPLQEYTLDISALGGNTPDYFRGVSTPTDSAAINPGLNIMMPAAFNSLLVFVNGVQDSGTAPGAGSFEMGCGLFSEQFEFPVSTPTPPLMRGFRELTGFAFASPDNSAYYMVGPNISANAASSLAADTLLGDRPSICFTDTLSTPVQTVAPILSFGAQYPVPESSIFTVIFRDAGSFPANFVGRIRLSAFAINL